MLSDRLALFNYIVLPRLHVPRNVRTAVRCWDNGVSKYVGPDICVSVSVSTYGWGRWYGGFAITLFQNLVNFLLHHRHAFGTKADPNVRQLD